MDLIDKILDAESRKLTIEYIVDNNYFNPNLDIYVEIKNKDEQDYLVNMIEVSRYEIIRFLDISHFKDTRETLKEYPKYIYLESLKNKKIMFNIYTSKAMESVKGLFNVIDIYDIDYMN